MVIAATALFFGGLSYAQKPVAGAAQSPTRKLVDIKGNVMYPIDVGDSTAICIVGEVAFYHNGAVITCDSAVRYSDSYMECFGNVLLNKDDTYAYGDRADYNGRLNIANIYSPLIKVRNGDATLYTLNFTFNTKTNTGKYSGMGVVFDGDNTIESDRGFFFSDRNTMVCVGRVQLKNDTYRMISDSLSYNTDSDRATFFTRSYIWNNNNEILTAIKGTYDNKTKVYEFVDSAYILTATRELWADSINYYGTSEDAEMYGNIQLYDKGHSSLGFGDLGHYWNERGQTLLTRMPSILTIDEKTSDTMFLRADTMFLYVYYPSDTRDTTAVADSPDTKVVDPMAHLAFLDSLSIEVRTSIADSLDLIVGELKGRIDSIMHIADSLETIANKPIEEPDAKADSTLLTADSLASTTTLDSLDNKSKERSTKPQKQRRTRTKRSVEALNKTPKKTHKRGDSSTHATDSLSLAGDSSRMVVDSTIIKADSSVQTIDSTQLEPPRPSHIIPPECIALRNDAKLYSPRYDSLGTVVKYLRSKLPPVEAKVLLPDSATVARRDSTLRADSLARVDSLRIHDRKAFKRLVKIQVQREKKALAAAREARREAEMERREALREERYIAKLKKKGLWTPPDTTAVIKADTVDSTALNKPDTLLHVVEPEPHEVDTVERVIRGFHNVRIFKSDMQAVADSIAAFSKDSTIVLYIDPVMWNGENQITSVDVTLYTDGNAVDRAYFTGDPIMASKIDDKHFNQVAGKTMTAFFRDNEIYRNDVNGNAQSLYWMQEDDSPEVVAYMHAVCGDITFMIANQTVSDIIFRGNPEWPIYPPDKIPADEKLLLDWFKWQPERKPTKQQVFDRTVRPSVRTRYEAMEQPTFPIALVINNKRTHLQKYYNWVDRNDLVNEQVVEWVNSLKQQ